MPTERPCGRRWCTAVINRAPKPDHSFLLIRNEVARDDRLSYRASGVLADILSRPDNWVTSAERLAAARPHGEGVKAMRTALRELEAAGYLRRVRTRDKDGTFGWEQAFYDTPQAVEGKTAGRTVSPLPPGGGLPDGFGPSKEDRERTTVEEDELECPHSGRFAPSVGAHENPNDHDPWGPIPQPRASTENDDTEEHGDWRDEDRQLFAEIVGARLESVGGRWKKGTWPANAFYNAYRSKTDRHGNRKPIKWPGRYLQGLAETRDDALDDWLLSEGLERIE